MPGPLHKIRNKGGTPRHLPGLGPPGLPPLGCPFVVRVAFPGIPCIHGCMINPVAPGAFRSSDNCNFPPSALEQLEIYFFQSTVREFLFMNPLKCSRSSLFWGVRSFSKFLRGLGQAPVSSGPTPSTNENSGNGGTRYISSWEGIQALNFPYVGGHTVILWKYIP